MGFAMLNPSFYRNQKSQIKNHKFLYRLPGIPAGGHGLLRGKAATAVRGPPYTGDQAF
jgi:hypothetical protein